MRKSGDGQALHGALPYLLGLCFLLTLLIPQLALHRIYQLCVRGAMGALLTYLVASGSIIKGIQFIVPMALVTWALDINEGAVAVCFAVAGLALALVVHSRKGHLFVRIAVGCIACALTLAVGVCGLAVWRKASEILPELRFALVSEIPTLIALLLGGAAAGYMARR